jgi:hypothetical protein
MRFMLKWLISTILVRLNTRGALASRSSSRLMAARERTKHTMASLPSVLLRMYTLFMSPGGTGEGGEAGCRV